MQYIIKIKTFTFFNAWSSQVKFEQLDEIQTKFRAEHEDKINRIQEYEQNVEKAKGRTMNRIREY